MNRTQHIHFLLGEKYGHENIGLINVISYKVDAKEQKDGDNIVWSVENLESGQRFISGHKFININTKEFIDLRKEKEEGLFI